MKDYILELDKTRTLRFGFKATRLIRQKFGDRNLDQLLNIKVDEMPILAWAGLKHGDNALTVEQVEDLLDEAIPKTYTVLKATEIVLEALAAHMGVEVKKVAADVLKKLAPKVEVGKPATEEKKEPEKVIPSKTKHKK